MAKSVNHPYDPSNLPKAGRRNTRPHPSPLPKERGAERQVEFVKVSHLGEI